jgi:hypothetical protein
VAETKFRCPECGAKNKPAVRCRLCGGMLPGGLERQQETAGGTDTFTDLVEAERAAWRQYDEGNMSSASKSRRPPELPKTDGAIELPVPKGGWLRRR